MSDDQALEAEWKFNARLVDAWVRANGVDRVLGPLVLQFEAVPSEIRQGYGRNGCSVEDGDYTYHNAFKGFLYILEHFRA
jgi:hypothetical protein